MRKHKPLRVLQAARQYSDLIIELSARLPARGPAGLRAQLVDAARSVSASISEGFGRGSDTEKIHYTVMANGSLEETQDYLRKYVNARLIERKTFYRLWNLSVVISRMIASMLEELRKRKEE